MIEDKLTSLCEELNEDWYLDSFWGYHIYENSFSIFKFNRITFRYQDNIFFNIQYLDKNDIDYEDFKNRLNLSFNKKKVR